MRMFPLQTSRRAPPGPRQIPWSVAEIAYGAYSREHGTGQSLEQLAERGGFGWCEMDDLYPKWREEVSTINQCRRETASAIRDIASRIGVARLPESVRDELDKLATRLEFHADV